MAQGHRDNERFWIAFTVRIAFGLMFAMAAMKIFTFADKPLDSVQQFADALSKPYEATWVNVKWYWWGAELNEETNQVIPIDVGIRCVRYFLIGMPFIFSVLSLCLLTGIFLFPAMRLSAIYLVLLGLGKYIVGDEATTAHDFIYAAFVLVGLYMASGRKDSIELGDEHEQ
jgi:hypothetical protein